MFNSRSIKEKVFKAARHESVRDAAEFEHGVAEILGKKTLDSDSVNSTPWMDEKDAEVFGAEEKLIFLKELVKDPYSYGLPAHQVDSFLEQLSFAMGLPSVTFRLETNGYWVITDSATKYIACPKTANLSKLTKTIELANKIVQGSAGIEIVESLYHIRHVPNAYPPGFLQYTYQFPARASQCFSSEEMRLPYGRPSLVALYLVLSRRLCRLDMANPL